MRQPTLTFTLLSMFTTTEKASEIEGDLIEQSHLYGESWLRRQVPLVALALLRRAIFRNGVPIAVLSVPAFAALFASVMLSERIYRAGLGAYLVEGLALPLAIAKLTVLGAVVPFASYCIGAAVVRAAPTLGPTVVAAVAIVFTLFVTAMHLSIDAPATIPVKLAIEFVLVTAPLLWGGIAMHRGALRRLT